MIRAIDIFSGSDGKGEPIRMLQQILKMSAIASLVCHGMVGGVSAKETSANHNPPQALANEETQLEEEARGLFSDRLLTNSCLGQPVIEQPVIERYYFLDDQERTEADKKLAGSLEGSNANYVEYNEIRCLKASWQLFKDACDPNNVLNKDHVKTINEFGEILNTKTIRQDMRTHSLAAYHSYRKCFANNALEDQRRKEEREKWNDKKYIQEKPRAEKIEIIKEQVTQLNDAEVNEVVLKIHKMLQNHKKSEKGIPGLLPKMMKGASSKLQGLAK